MKFNRRSLLWAGLAASAATAGIKEHLRTLSLQQQSGLSSPADDTIRNHLSIMSAAYSSEANWEEEVSNRKALLSFDALVPPTVPYRRDRSKMMMTFCKLAVQQYKTGRADADYGGEINLLPTYRRTLSDYEQIANFTIEEEIIEEYFKASGAARAEGIVGSSTIDDELEAIELTLHDRLRHILQKKYRIDVYSGLAVASAERNVLVFRGTQTQTEWLKNLNAKQVPYVAPDGKTYGEVHEGFYKLMQALKPSLESVVKQLDPTIPCYVTGHSLGSAIATLASMEISYLVPEMRENIRLYSYAGPRVGSPAFAKAYSERLPNTYRVVNLGDAVPLVPPVTMGDSYVHVGEEWSFLVQSGDTLLNHVVDTYREALDQELESISGNSQVNRLKIT